LFDHPLILTNIIWSL